MKNKRPQIVEIKAKKLIGVQIETTLSDNKIRWLWEQFIPRRKEIHNTIDQNLYSVQVYEGGLKINEFNASTKFEKWAAMEVIDFDSIPLGMDSLILSGGLYAVFIHAGVWNRFHETSQYIFGNWLPDSQYELDNRAHFEVMGDKYLSPDDPGSEEEIWVPVKHVLK